MLCSLHKAAHKHTPALYLPTLQAPLHHLQSWACAKSNSPKPKSTTSRALKLLALSFAVYPSTSAVVSWVELLYEPAVWPPPRPLLPSAIELRSITRSVGKIANRLWPRSISDLHLVKKNTSVWIKRLQQFKWSLVTWICGKNEFLTNIFIKWRKFRSCWRPSRSWSPSKKVGMGRRWDEVNLQSLDVVAWL